jgi:nitrate/TMAO reductase-like tetraheme cytochrome c subunit
MEYKRWLLISAFTAAGAVVGAGAVIATVEANRYTSTDAFCTSCHTMAIIAAEPYFRQSAHRSNRVGVLASCGDCHIPATDWFGETYTHVSQALHDVAAEYTGNFSDPAVWKVRRAELARHVRDNMRSNDSVTCRKCHDAAAINPASESGRAAHALLAQGQMTCIDCHLNTVHAPASAP